MRFPKLHSWGTLNIYELGDTCSMVFQYLEPDTFKRMGDANRLEMWGSTKRKYREGVTSCSFVL